tara:strand:- start:4389 stop:4658 length:270 start_codon:yes stop_codon:yes gene_type:complete
MSYYKKNEQVDSLSLEGKRFPLEQGRLFKVRNQRGIYRVHQIYVCKDDSELVEIHAWWRDKKMFTGGKAHWRFVKPENIKHILKDVESI